MSVSSESGNISMSQIEALSRRTIRQLPMGGGTAEMFLVTDCGKTTLMKRLRHELLSKPYYRDLFNKEYQVGALLDCPHLTDVTLPSTLHTIERGVFYRCRKIEEITIPASVRDIGVYTFMDCTSLRRIYNYAEEPQRCVSLFNSDTQITVYVPAASVERYKAAECWRDCIIRAL